MKPRARHHVKDAMVGRVYEVPTRTAENRTSGACGPWQVFEGGTVRVVVQGAGWPTNVLVERVERDHWLGEQSTVIDGVPYRLTGERFVRPARGMRRLDVATPCR